MVDSTAPSGPGVLVLNDQTIPHGVQLSKLRAFAAAAHADGKTKVLAQLCHPGRAAIHLPSLPFTTTTKKQNLAPSAVRVSFGEGLVARAMAAMLCGTPREMTPADMDAVVDKFATAARLMSDAGLDGVELHGAHGYLLSQFLSAEANTRTDEYGGSAIKRTKFVTRVIEAVRATVPSGFIVGIKLNSVDYQTDRHGARAEAGEGEVMDKEAQLRECIEQFGAIAAVGVDFVEVSGGTWADPQMVCFSGQYSSSRGVNPSRKTPPPRALLKRCSFESTRQLTRHFYHVVLRLAKVYPHQSPRSLLPELRRDVPALTPPSPAHGHGRVLQPCRHGRGGRRRRHGPDWGRARVVRLPVAAG